MTQPSNTFIDDTEAERRTSLSKAWFRKQRVNRTGPPWLRVGRRIVYDWDALRSWMLAQPGGGDQQLAGGDRG